MILIYFERIALTISRWDWLRMCPIMFDMLVIMTPHQKQGWKQLVSVSDSQSLWLSTSEQLTSCPSSRIGYFSSNFSLSVFRKHSSNSSNFSLYSCPGNVLHKMVISKTYMASVLGSESSIKLKEGTVEQQAGYMVPLQCCSQSYSGASSAYYPGHQNASRWPSDPGFSAENWV